MFATGTTELIWHFAGYLRLPEFDFGTPTIRYDGQAPGTAPDEPEGKSPHPLRILGSYELPDVRLGSLKLLESNDPLWHSRHIHIREQFAHPHVYLGHLHPHQSSVPPQSFGEVGSDYQLSIKITATYHSGGDQELVDVHQTNVMTSNNLFDNHAINAPIGTVLANDAFASQEINKLIGAAAHAPGHDFLPHAADTAQLISFVNTNDADHSAMPAHLAPFTVHPGTYVNGELYTGAGDPHQATNDALNTLSTALNDGLSGSSFMLSGDGHALSAQTVSVGSNIVANNALLANFEGASLQLAVHGNFYQVQAIVQTNVFAESDQISGTAASSAHISIAPNNVENIGDFQQQTPLLTSGGSGETATDLHWNVTVLNGSLYDVHSLVQTNYLTNNNVVYESTTTGISQVIAGGNTLANVGQFENLTTNYDLIVVQGNYHQDNLIYQTNVVLDANLVNLNGDGTAAQSLSGGGNTLVNDASIVNVGNYSFQPMNESALSVLHSLETQQGTLNIGAIESAFPDLVGNINVLVVSGDYYDVNYLSQTNIISNANTVVMNGSQGDLASASQTVETGHNTAVNSASIYDAGSATSPLLGGQYSNEMILIQSNIVADGAKITGSDPNQLVPELVAFTGTAESAAAPTTTSTTATTDLQHHANDPMASILH